MNLKAPPILERFSSTGLYDIIDTFTVNPRSILGLEIPQIKEGEKAELSIFDPELHWTYEESNNYSKSLNSPMLGQKLKGQVLGVINNGRSFINDFS